MEKILSACKITKKGGLGKALSSVMFEKSVPGFCTELKEAVKMFDVKDPWFQNNKKS